jgi:hypothetical protein
MSLHRSCDCWDRVGVPNLNLWNWMVFLIKQLTEIGAIRLVAVLIREVVREL